MHYYPNGTTDEADEHFIWEINVPVKITEPVQLTYSVKLVNKPTEKGNYQLDTNKIATLTPKDTDGNIYPTEEFPVPVVDYEVLETITPTVPEWEKSKSKTATNLDNNFESKVTLSLPSASYKGNLDVAFVLDGSTSTKKKDLAVQAANLLDELSEMKNLNVKASLTIFGGSKTNFGGYRISRHF